ncbi:hypothetical protein D1872_253850 [compost metagenome]
MSADIAGARASKSSTSCCSSMRGRAGTTLTVTPTNSQKERDLPFIPGRSAACGRTKRILGFIPGSRLRVKTRRRCSWLRDYAGSVPYSLAPVPPGSIRIWTNSRRPPPDPSRSADWPCAAGYTVFSPTGWEKCSRASETPPNRLPKPAMWTGRSNISG